MLRRSGVLGMLMFAASISVGWAQSPAGPGNSTGRTPLTAEQRQELRTARSACRAEIKVDSSDRRARARAMRECVESKSAVARQIGADRAKRRSETREMRRECREGLKGRTLSRDERRQAMQACMVTKRPELKKTYECSNQAREKGFKSGRERRDFMRTCRRS